MHFFPDAEFYIQLSVHHSDKLYPTMLRHTRTLFDKPITDLTSFFRVSSDKKLLKLAKFVLYLLRSFVLLLFPNVAKILLDSKERQALATYFTSTCLVGKGGHYFYGGRKLADLVKVFIQAFPFLLARRLKIPYVLVGISVGPYGSWLERIIPKLVFTGAAAVSAREIESFKEISQIVGPNGRVYLSTDTALWLQCKAKNGQDKYVIFCPRVVFPHDKLNTKYNRYLEMCKWIISELVNTYRRQVVVVLTAVRPFREGRYDTEDDRQFVTDLQQSGLNMSGINFATQDVGLSDLLNIFANAEFVIGTRLHSVIFAMLCGKPFIGISYYGPKMKVVENYGFGEFIVSIDQLDRRRLKSLIENIIAYRADLARRIEEKAAVAKEIVQTDGALQVLCDLIIKR